MVSARTKYLSVFYRYYTLGTLRHTCIHDHSSFSCNFLSKLSGYVSTLCVCVILMWAGRSRLNFVTSPL